MTDPYISDSSAPLPPPPTSSLAKRRRRPWGIVAAVAIGLPILEIVLLVLLGRGIGVWWTLLLLVAEAAIGAYLLKREGRRAWRAVTDAVRTGDMPTGELARAALVVVGAVLFVLPGLITDILGLLCLIPGTRALMGRLLLKAVGIDPRRQPAAVQRHRPSGAGQTIDGEVVEGDVQDAFGRDIRYLER